MQLLKRIFNNKLLLATFLSTFFYALSAPLITQTIMSNISSKLISINGIIICISTIVIGNLWQTYEKKVYRYYDLFLTTEIVLYIFLILFLLTGKINYYIYYFVESFVFALITKSIIFGGNSLKEQYFTDLEERKIYDNDNHIVMSISSLLGFILNYFIIQSIPISFILFFIAISVDNIIYLFVFYKLNTPRGS